MNFSEFQSRDLQLHDEQLTNQRSDEGTLKIKHSRTRVRKSPYHQPTLGSCQINPPQLQTVAQHVTNDLSISPLWQPLNINKWNYSSSKGVTDYPQHYSSYLASRNQLAMQPDQSPGGSNSSCIGESSPGQHTPHTMSPSLSSHVDIMSSCYWPPRSNCIFGTAFDSSQNTPEEIYKAAYGTYYQQLAASAARTYGHIQTPSKLTDFYYTNPYSRFASSYTSPLTGP